MLDIQALDITRAKLSGTYLSFSPRKSSSSKVISKSVKPYIYGVILVTRYWYTPVYPISQSSAIVH